MEQGGRVSAAELGISVIDVQMQRLKPPGYLKTEARAIWEHVVDHSDPRHFKQNEAPLLSLYCTSIHLARFYATAIGEEGDDGRNHKNWCRERETCGVLSDKVEAYSVEVDTTHGRRIDIPPLSLKKHRDRGIKLADEQRVMGRSPVQGGRYGASPRFRLGEP